MIQQDEILAKNAKQLGAVYTPDFLSSWVCELLLKNIGEGTILDPACGDGSLLVSASEMTNNSLIGVDIVNQELIKVHEKIKENNLKTFNLDTLNPNLQNPFFFWSNFLKENNVKAILSNPPWGSELVQSRKELLDLGFSLAEGQYDSYELFIELMLAAASVGTFFSLIIPDSLFLPEHTNLRKLILINSKIKLIARLGEGFFKNIFRGTTVLILEKVSEVCEDNLVECIRLNKDWRANVLTRKVTLSNAQKSLAHFVSQKRFLNNKDYIFDIDIMDTETAVGKIETVKKLTLSDYLNTGRGIEISKLGVVGQCPKCRVVYPLPKNKDEMKCVCGNAFIPSSNTEITIIDKKKTAESLPIVVGEDVSRYQVQQSRYIKKNVAGINYKSTLDFKGPKILIRKTGVGINAGLDYSGAYTNQVVFQYSIKDKDSCPDFFLEYVLGVLSSRVMCAYFLKKFGDNEWRSHAYITQKIIAQLPIPDIFSSTEKFKLAKKIGSLVKEIQSADSDKQREIDIEIEKLVIKIYELDSGEAKWVMTALGEAQQLKALRALALTSEELKKLYEL